MVGASETSISFDGRCLKFNTNTLIRIHLKKSVVNEN